MKVINSELLSTVEHIQKKSLISSVIESLFSISKLDENFQIDSKVKVEEKEILRIKEKVKKQVEITKRISSLKESMTKKISYLSSENSRTKSRLLTKLGVEEWI